MSRSTPPAYHLRANKAVDRLLFVELLRALEGAAGATPVTYVGLGGPYVEDFRLLSAAFPEMSLVCVESDAEIHKRQLFHNCSSKMVCINTTLGRYVATELPSDQPVAVWADYSNMSRECLEELAAIIRKATPGSIVRITVRAETPIFEKLDIDRRHYPNATPEAKRDQFARLQATFRADMAVDGIAFPQRWFDWTAFSRSGYPELLAKMIGAVAVGSCTHPKTYLPLHTVKYSDNTWMLSKTGLVCDSQSLPALRAFFGRRCSFCNPDGDLVNLIDVPVLTTKERLHLEAVLPSVAMDGSSCTDRLGYLIEGEDSEPSSAQKLEQYERYYRLYPYFGKILP